jgi:hypothetical protein
MTTEPTTQLTTDETTEPTTELTTDETTEPTTELTTDETTEPTTELTTDETTEPTTEPTTDETTEPTTELDTTRPRFDTSEALSTLDQLGELAWADPAELVLEVNTRTEVHLDPHFCASVRDRGVREPISVYRRDDHSDRGSNYTSLRFGQGLEDHGILASMGSVGDSYDNALMENFFSTLKTELVYRRSWRSREEAENELSPISTVGTTPNASRPVWAGSRPMSTRPPGAPSKASWTINPHHPPTGPPRPRSANQRSEPAGEPQGRRPARTRSPAGGAALTRSVPSPGPPAELRSSSHRRRRGLPR